MDLKNYRGLPPQHEELQMPISTAGAERCRRQCPRLDRDCLGLGDGAARGLWARRLTRCLGGRDALGRDFRMTARARNSWSTSLKHSAGYT